MQEWERWRSKAGWNRAGLSSFTPESERLTHPVTDPAGQHRPPAGLCPYKSWGLRGPGTCAFSKQADSITGRGGERAVLSDTQFFFSNSLIRLVTPFPGVGPGPGALHPVQCSPAGALMGFRCPTGFRLLCPQAQDGQRLSLTFSALSSLINSLISPVDSRQPFPVCHYGTDVGVHRSEQWSHRSHRYEARAEKVTLIKYTQKILPFPPLSCHQVLLLNLPGGNR